jgi:hypothetical protein
MTIALSVKVNDGVVIAADSASTLIGQGPNGRTAVINVYNNANKVFNLCKGLPVGAITWGAGSIGTASTSTLLKDFRKFISGENQERSDWIINRDSYSIEAIAQHFRQFIFDELYAPAFKDWPEKPALGFVIAGYSSSSEMAEEYRIDIQNGQCTGPSPVRGNHECGLNWNGEPEAINRLLLGYGINLPHVLQANLGVPEEQIPHAMGIIMQSLTVPLVTAAMPIQDAIDLAEFLVDATIKFSKFRPGAPTVGGPIEIAAITKHEGFKWVRRKHYYSGTYNK